MAAVSRRASQGPSPGSEDPPSGRREGASPDRRRAPSGPPEVCSECSDVLPAPWAAHRFPASPSRNPVGAAPIPRSPQSHSLFRTRRLRTDFPVDTHLGRTVAAAPSPHPARPLSPRQTTPANPHSRTAPTQRRCNNSDYDAVTLRRNLTTWWATPGTPASPGRPAEDPRGDRGLAALHLPPLRRERPPLAVSLVSPLAIPCGGRAPHPQGFGLDACLLAAHY